MIVHKTKYGETFDMLAKLYYGNEKLMHFIVEANEHLRDKLFFDGEYEVVIPDLPEEILLNEEVPPWKR